MVSLTTVSIATPTYKHADHRPLLGISPLYCPSLAFTYRSSTTSSSQFLALPVIDIVGINALALRHEEERHYRPDNPTRKEDPQHIGNANLRRVAQVVEQHTRQDGAELARRSTDTMREATHTTGVDLAGHDEGGGIRTEVEEELCDSEAGEFAACAQSAVVACDNAEHETRDEEAADLDGFAAEDLDEADREEVARYVAGGSDDEISICCFE